MEMMLDSTAPEGFALEVPPLLLTAHRDSHDWFDQASSPVGISSQLATLPDWV
jgi:hypothetical protein